MFLFHFFTLCVSILPVFMYVYHVLIAQRGQKKMLGPHSDAQDSLGLALYLRQALNMIVILLP